MITDPEDDEEEELDENDLAEVEDSELDDWME